MEKKEKIKKSLKSLCSTAQCHGWPKLVNSDRTTVKLMLLAFILTSTGGCIYVLAKSVNSYLQYAVVANLNVISEMPMPFPALKICSLTPTLKNYSLKQIIIRCTFNMMTDCSNDFSSIYDGSLGYSCLLFNVGAPKFKAKSQVSTMVLS